MKYWTYLDKNDIALWNRGQIPNMWHNYYETRQKAREAKKHYRPLKGWWTLVQLDINITIKGA